jgi:hypothetical protein
VPKRWEMFIGSAIRHQLPGCEGDLNQASTSNPSPNGAYNNVHPHASIWLVMPHEFSYARVVLNTLVLEHVESNAPARPESPSKIHV